MRNEKFLIEMTNGCITSMILADDADKMNWVNSEIFQFGWGELYFKSNTSLLWFREDQFKLKSLVENDSFSEAVFETRCLRCTVRRWFNEEGNLCEEYAFKNISKSDVFTKACELGIYLPFSDNYVEALVSQKHNCNTHIWCGENISWINALRQGNSDQNIGLVLKKGSLVKYSLVNYKVERKGYAERGAFILHPETMELLPGEEYVLQWEIVPHSGTEEFFSILAKRQPISNICADVYTVFADERIHFSFDTDAQKVTVLLDGVDVPTKKENQKYVVDYQPVKFGEHKFILIADGVSTHVSFWATKTYEKLLEDRINFIVDHQQYHREGSALDGAYLIYDNKENIHVFDDRFEWVDHNASRERIGMPLLITRYLQTHTNAKFYDSLMKYVEFVKRECVELETGEVFNTIGKNRAMIRLYNAPWMIQLFSELYILEGKAEYMEFVHKALRHYYSGGGLKFYPNGIRVGRVLYALEKYGNKQYYDEALDFFKRHADNMVANGLDYPMMEVIFEQTIVSPAASIITEIAIATKEQKYLDAVQQNFDVLVRFDGMQPDYHLNHIAIRYWDDYWFGKTQTKGDTLPHYWSCLSAAAYKLYYDLTGNEQYRKYAEMGIRNCLCLFDEKGRGSCAYVYPFRVDQLTGEFFDEWANDQDFALYFMLTMKE